MIPRKNKKIKKMTKNKKRMDAKDYNITTCIQEL